MTNYEKLLTLARDGEVTAKILVPEFENFYHICNIYVAATGQVFVFGRKYISQVNTDAKKVLNTIKLDVSNTGALYFNEATHKLIAGFFYNDNIIVLKTKTIQTS